MKFNGNFIGYEKPNTSYLKDTILYKYNKLGHRCKDVSDINLDNYILFAGCSHTAGEGLHLEQTYPYITSKQLNCDYYNLGLEASGFDVLFYNLMSWLSVYPKPKLIVIQYPDQNRFSTLISESALIVPYGPWRKKDEDLDFLIKGTDLGLFLFRNMCYRKLLDQYIDVPLVKLVFGGTKSYDADSIRINKLDLAVDNQHYGIDTHAMCADVICEQYQTKYIT